MTKPMETVLVVASGDWDIVPAPSDITALGIEWDVADVREHAHGSVTLYGARNVPNPLVSGIEGMELYWRRKPPVAQLRERNAGIFRAHLAGAILGDAGAPHGLSRSAARLAVRSLCVRAFHYFAGIELGWYRDIGEMGERLFLTAKEAEVAGRLGKIYYGKIGGRDPDDPSPMLQAKRIIDRYRA